MTKQDLLDLSKRLEVEAAERKVDADTKEQWSAVICLQDAARHVYAAAGWLQEHDQKYGQGVGADV